MEWLPPHGWQRTLVLILYLILGMGALYLFFSRILVLILPFLLALLIALALRPVTAAVCCRVRLPEKIVGIGLLTLLLLAVAAFAVFIAGRVIREVEELAARLAEHPEALTDAVDEILTSLSERLPIISAFGDADYLMTAVNNLINSAVNGLIGQIPPLAGSVIAAMPGILFFSAVLIIASYYVSAGLPAITQKIRSLLPTRIADALHRAADGMKQMGFGYLRAYLLILLVTFSQLLAGFTVLRIPYALTLALTVAFVDILPVIGVGTVLIPWSIFLLLRGDLFTGIGLLIMFAVISVVRQVVEPRIVGLTLGLHPLTTLMAMYAGVRLCGFAGLILLPLSLIVAKNLYRATVGRRAASPEDGN